MKRSLKNTALAVAFITLGFILMQLMRAILWTGFELGFAM